MVQLMEKAEIITLYKAKKSLRYIAKYLGISRQTVRKYIDTYLAEQKELDNCSDPIKISELQEKMLSKNVMDTSKRKPTKFTGKLKERFDEILLINEERNRELGPNKQEVNGAVIFRELQREGFDIGESTVRAYFSNYRRSHKEVFIKQTYEYGDRVDFDFHQIKLIIDGVKKTYHQVTISCPKSNFIFVKLYHNETIKSVIKGIIEFFRYCGGVFNEVTFDNLKPVVKVYGYRNEKELTEDITKFAAYYGFKVNTCNARRGNEKGHVENSGKHARPEMFSLKYKFSSEDELNAYVEERLNIINKDSLVDFSIEKQHLKPLPMHDYLIGEYGLGIISSYSFLTINGKFYSVPDTLAGKELRYSIINDIIVIYDGNKEVARHKKIDTDKSYSIDIYHYLNTFKKKPGALARSLALKQSDKEIIDIYNTHYKEKPKEFIEYLFGDKKEESNINKIESTSINQLQQINELYSITGGQD